MTGWKWSQGDNRKPEERDGCTDTNPKQLSSELYNHLHILTVLRSSKETDPIRQVYILTVCGLPSWKTARNMPAVSNSPWYLELNPRTFNCSALDRRQQRKCGTVSVTEWQADAEPKSKALLKTSLQKLRPNGASEKYWGRKKPRARRPVSVSPGLFVKRTVFEEIENILHPELRCPNYGLIESRPGPPLSIGPNFRSLVWTMVWRNFHTCKFGSDRTGKSESEQ